MFLIREKVGKVEGKIPSVFIVSTFAPWTDGPENQIKLAVQYTIGIVCAYE